ncbi:MAG: hypothetical protein ACK5UE_06135, partial [Chitinophagales bacterium]
MKKILNLTKRIALLSAIVLIYQSGFACANRGNIKVDTSRCDIGRAKLWLVNHTTTAGTTYLWQSSNDGGISWGTMATNSGKDTQLVVPLLGRMYRCISVCPSSTAVSDTVTFNLQNRTITVDQKFCSGNDSLLLKAAPPNAPTDTAFAKNFRWQVSTTNGVLWDNIGGNSSTLKVEFNSFTEYKYRAFVTFCRLTGPTSAYPTSQPQLVGPEDVSIVNGRISMTGKDCVNDSARFGLVNVFPNSMKNFLNYDWEYVGGSIFDTSGRDSFKNIKVIPDLSFVYLDFTLCPLSFWHYDDHDFDPSIGSLEANYNCSNDFVEIDYSNRDPEIKDFHKYWNRSSNDTNNFTLFTDPVDSVLYSYQLQNNTNYFYRVYSKFCPTSSKNLDSSNILNVKLKIDTGQLKGSFQTCTNDSVYLKLLNYKDSSSFPLIKKWMVMKNGSNIWEDYNQAPLTDTTIIFRMNNGLNSYRKSVALCADKYARKWSSTIASTFLPFQAVYNASCTGNMTINVLNDTVKIIDYTGTIPRSNSTFAYQWLRSTNKVSSNIIGGANSANLTITQADRGSFFRRLTRICSGNTFSDTTNWSNTTVGTPTVQNGRAIVVDQICLNETVQVCLDNYFPLTTDTPTFVWQYSPDDITWTNMNTSKSNDTCITAVVGAEFQYYRRLTSWCPSGRIDSSVSTPVVYIKNLPWFESFTAQQQFGRDILFNCWRASSPVCNTYSPTYAGGQIWSRATGGKSGKFMANWGPAPQDPKAPPGRRNDMKLITPAFDLKRGKVYRFSFWHRETTANLCWDSLYVTWGTKPTPCDMTNKFGEQLTKFSFDQYNKFWSDFTPPDDGIYYFAINLRESSPTTGEVGFDEVGLKEVESCLGKTPIKGTTFAPSRIIDRSEEPSIADNYDKSRVTHQYCLHDTIMLTYQEANYNSNFDYHGMTYQFWKKRSDQDWKIEDTFFRPVPSDTLCHITNRSNYHVMNVLVTDTHTWYKIVATCQYDGKRYDADSLLINGTHSVPYCEDWEAVGNIQNQQSPMPGQNSGEISGQVPSFAYCPACWGGYPQVTPTNPQPNPQNLHSFTLPIRNPPPGPPAPPQLSPDAGYNGNDVVLSSALPATTNRKVLVFPAVRLYKNRGYRISMRWTDNRTSTQSPWGNVNQDLDSLYLTVVKGNESGKVIDSFPRSKMVPNSLQRDLQSNILENGPAKYRTFWVDYSPNDTGTYYFGIVIVPGPANGGAYRFIMDYFCIDTLAIDDCTDQPKFTDPLRVRVNPDGKTWLPGDTEIVPAGVQWCVGNRVNLELDFGLSTANAWKYGWKMYWQRTTQEFPPKTWTTIDSTNGINFMLSNKFQDYRLILANSCRTKFDTIGPFKVGPYRGTPSCAIGTRETFLNEQFGFAAVLPQCWDVYPSCRVKILDDAGVGNEFKQRSKLHKNYLDMDFISPATPNCQMPTVQTAVPPGYGATGGVTYRFSFWYKDNGISVPIDSIVAGYSFSRPTDAYQVRLLNKVNNDVVKNSRTNKWRYYTTEVTSSVDTAFHFKIKTFNIGNKRIYRTMFDDLLFKPRQSVDALVIAIDSPEYACDLTANTTVKVTVMNIGTSTLTDLPIKVQVGTATPVSHTIPGALAANETRTVFVPNVDLSVVGVNEIKAWTEAPGEQFNCDDTFYTEITHLEMPKKPTDTIDSVCVCKPHTMLAPYANARWYKNVNDFTPIYNGPDFSMDSVCKDTNIFYSMWNGAVCNTYPPNFSYGAPTYRVPVVGGATPFGEGIAFDNISKDTILIDSVMVYVNSITTTPTFNVNLTQFVGGQRVLLNQVSIQNFTKLGRQWMPIKIKVPPGTDYKLLYAGTSSLAQLPGFIFLGAGCVTMDITFYGDETYPAAASAYRYFFNWKLIKLGCETERVKKDIKVLPSPKFQLKDTARVCSQPVFQFCGPAAASGDTFRYKWASANPGDTNQCKGATVTGWYNLTVTNQYGCEERDSTQTIVDPSPEFTLGLDTSFCRYSPHTLQTGLDSTKNVVTWSDNQAGVNIKIFNPGSYIATAYNTQNFCTAKDTINVIRYDLPVFSLGNDRVFCGTNANLQSLAPNLPTNLNYTWGGSSPGAPIISSSGTYWAEGFDPTTKCKNRDSVIANLQPKPPFDLGANVMACGSSYTINGPTGNYFYKWNTTATTRSINVSTPGTYYLTITNKTFGCDSVDSVQVRFKAVPVFDLGSDVVKCDTTHLLTGPTPPSGDNYTYSWKKPDGSTSGGSTFIADKSGVYYLTVDNACYNFSDSIRITLKVPPKDAIDLLRDTAGCRKVNLQATSTTNYTNLTWTGPTGSSVTGSKANTVLA